MAENFARHRSTRWVKSKSQSYDSWGDQYDDYRYDYQDQNLDNVDEEEQEEPLETQSQIPEDTQQVKPAAAPLVLSIDQIKKRSETDESLDEETSHYRAGGHNDLDDHDESWEGADPVNDTHIQLETSQIRVSTPVDHAPPNNMAPIITSGLKDDSDFFPPTPTFTMKQYVQPPTPETPHSDRSYMSDSDSIQREPDNLNLAYGDVSLNRIREELPVEAGAASGQNPPDELVLTIDRMNLDSSDESSLDEGAYDRHIKDSFRFETQKDSSNPYDEILNAENTKARIVDSSAEEDDNDDDWGYNSQHSSNDEEVEHLNTTERVLSSGSSTRQPIKTDALDSLINDLLKMERLSTMYLEQLLRAAPVAAQVEAASVSEAKQSLPEKAAEQNNHHQHEDDEAIPEDLTSLSSMSDPSSPDVENKESEIDPLQSQKDILPQEFQKQHETFLSNVLKRSSSVRKAPPFAQEHLSESLASHVPDSDIKLLSSNKTDTGSKLEPVISSGSISTGNASFDIANANFPPLAPPGAKADPDSLGRRVSTASTQTFNFGAWKPNTNKFRDQFVNQNDAESQMNVSIYNSDESTYKKFTGMRPPSGYAESLSNSDMISVPDTIDAPLPSIVEDGLGDQEDDDIIEEKLTRDTFATSSQLDIHTVNTNAPSVLKEHSYDPTFEEERSTPAASADNLPTEDKAATGIRAPSEGLAGTSSSRKLSDLPSTIISTLKPPMQKYPVFKWKQIMSVSQPVDRIELLRKAQVDEMNYDTKLNFWLNETLKSVEVSPHIQIGALATQAYQNAQHSDLRRHTSIRSKVSLVKDKMETGNFGLQASSFGRKFLSRGKKFMKSGSD